MTSAGDCRNHLHHRNFILLFLKADKSDTKMNTEKTESTEIVMYEMLI